jgi:hypothetical protein
VEIAKNNSPVVVVYELKMNFASCAKRPPNNTIKLSVRVVTPLAKGAIARPSAPRVCALR